MVDYKVIGLRLKTYRQQAGLTQETVAERAGITVVYLSKIENGHVRPTIDLLRYTVISAAFFRMPRRCRRGISGSGWWSCSTPAPRR